MPVHFRTTLSYAEKISINATSGVAATQVFSANGLYDPDVTGTGHQPRGFDQLMAMYDHYVVERARIVVRTDNSGNSRPGILAIMVRDSATASSEILDYLENNRATKGLTGCSGSKQQTFSHSVDVGKFLGRSNVLADPELKGSASANPTEQLYFHVSIGDTDDITNLNAVFCIMEIQYDVVLIEPKVPSSS
jgi:hypothetical protein